MVRSNIVDIGSEAPSDIGPTVELGGFEVVDMTLAAYEGNYPSPSPAARPSGMEETLDEVAQKEPEQPQPYDHYKGNKGWTKWLGKHLIPLSVFAGGAIIGGSVTHGVYTLKARNGPAGTTSTITSENIAVGPPTTNPGLITLKLDGGITISGSVKLPADIKVEGSLSSGAAIILNDGAVLDCNGHSITGDGDKSPGISGIVVEGDGTKVINCPAVTSFGKNGAFLKGKDVTIEKSSFSENGEDGIHGENNEGGTLEMIDVTAMDNEFDGIDLSGWDEITLNQIVVNENGFAALNIRNTWDNNGVIQVFDITALNNGGSFDDPYGFRNDPILFADKANRITIKDATVMVPQNEQVFEMFGIQIFDQNVELAGITIKGGGIEVKNRSTGFTSIKMKDVQVVDALINGIQIINAGSGVTTLENIISSKNDGGGLAYAGAGSLILNEVACADNNSNGLQLIAEGGPLDVVLEGKNSFHNNSRHGIQIEFRSSALTTVSVDGKTAVNDNREGGILFKDATGGSGSVDFEVVKKKGSLTTCGNSNFDWDTGNYVSTFTGPGKYVCGTPTGNDFPTCNPCKDEKSRKLGLGN